MSTTRSAGVWLVAAAVLFWACWALMPGVGITDTREIFARVSRHAGAVRLSAILQLASAACYAPALLGAVRALPGRAAFVGSALLLMGAMGSAADAVLHLLAAEMVAPGIDRAAMIPVMERMQGPNLRLLAPLIAAFFVGSGVLAVALARAGLVSRANPALLAAALGVVLAAALAPGAARELALAGLGLVSASQAWIGLALLRRPLAVC